MGVWGCGRGFSPHTPTHPNSHTFSNNNHATGFGISQHRAYTPGINDVLRTNALWVARQFARRLPQFDLVSFRIDNPAEAPEFALLDPVVDLDAAYVQAARWLASNWKVPS